MENLKAELNTSLNEQGERALTGTQVGNKFGLDVTIIGGSSGGGGGAGGNSLQINETGAALTSGISSKWRDSFETLNPLNFDFTSGIHANDLVTLDGNTQGSSFVRLSMGTDNVSTVSQIKGLKQFSAPFRIGYGHSISQRIQGELSIVRIAAVDADGVQIQAPGETTDIFSPSKSVAKVQVVSNVVYISFNEDHDYKYDDLICISGAIDTRANTFLRITGVRGRRMAFAALTIADTTFSIGASCVVNKINVSRGAMDCAGMLYNDTSTTNAIYFSRASGSSEFVSALSSFGTSYTDPLIPSSQDYSINLQPRMMTEITMALDLVRFQTTAIDSNSVNVAYKRTQSVANVEQKYSIFIETVALPNRQKPIEILTAVKTGTTTATVTTVLPHGLQSGAQVRVYGQRDQTAWPNVTTEVAITVTGANTFTLVWGTAVTQTVYGGVITPMMGVSSLNAALTTPINGAPVWANGKLFLPSTSTPAITRGDVVVIKGIASVTGVIPSNVSGRFVVEAVNPNIQESGIGVGYSTTSGTTTILMTDTSACCIGAILTGTGVGVSAAITAIVPNTSITVSVASVSTNTGQFGLIMNGYVLRPLDIVAPANSQPLENHSGAVLRIHDLRFNFFRALDYTQTPVEITQGNNILDTSLTIPTYSMGGSVGATQSSAAAISSTDGSGGWYIRPGIVGLPDIASAAITTTATSASTVNDKGNGFQVTVAVTAVTGTTPTLDLRIEESFDGGTNWVTLYEMQRITATGSYNTPILRASGRHIRYVRTIAGTTPSFTMALTRNLLPFIQAEPQKRLIDRSIVLTTLNSVTPVLFQGAANNVQLVINVGAITTTAPTIQLEGSEDGINFYAMGAPLTAVASSTVQLTVTDLSATYTRARVSTAGVGVTAGYVSIKAWS